MQDKLQRYFYAKLICMKKLLPFVVLLSVTFAVQAQNAKPSKEETIRFMNAVLKSVEGSVVEVKSSIGEHTIEQQTFDGTSYALHGYYPITKDKHLPTEVFSEIKWQSMDTESIIGHKISDDFTQVVVYFSSKCKHDGIEGIQYRDSMYMYVPTSKLPSFKKALLRLAEIAKEENKDPFAN